jgi:uncharacterized repeat protein (TIGR01451 family)
MKSQFVRRINLFVFGLFFAFALKAAPTLAQTVTASPAKQEIEAVLTSKKVVINGNNKETLIDAKEIKPGEIVEYRATYTNKSKAPVTKLVGTLPIPDGTEYVGGSANPAIGVLATLGDGKFAPIPLKRKVKLADGREVERDVPLADYRSLRWNLGDLGPGQSVSVTGRVRLPALNAAAAAASAVPSSGLPAQGGQK